MKKIIYPIFFLIILFPYNQPLLASESWDDAAVGKIARSLRGDPEALTMFMDRVALSVDESTMESDESLSIALKLPGEQVELNAGQILGNLMAINCARVFVIDLTDLVAGQEQAAINSIRGGSFPNLRVLNLPTFGLDAFVGQVFADENVQRKYISLQRIIANGGDITEDGISTIFHHFSGYDFFVRDMSQISERHGCVAAYLSVEDTGIEDFINPDWVRGRKSKEGHTIYYRVREPSAVDAPFIMTVSH